MSELQKIAGSAMAGSISNFVFLGSAYLLDKTLEPKISTFISLCLSTIVNFFMQQFVFGGDSENQSEAVAKFFTVALLNNSIILLLSNYFIDKKHYYQRFLPKTMRPQYNTVVRTGAGALSFIFIAYPLRRYWVFK